MKNISTLLLLTITLILVSCKQELINRDQDSHQEPTQNFTVKRLIILNDKNEMLMGKEEGNWYNPGATYSEPEFVKESLDSMADKYGIKISAPKLHGYFSYKYEYHPYSSLRAFYITRYVSGQIKTNGNMEDIQWMPVDEAIEKIPVESIKMATQQILDHPDTLWGGSFVVVRKGKHHHARMVEDFYPLFE